MSSKPLVKCGCCRMKRSLEFFTESCPDRRDSDVVKTYSSCSLCRKDRQKRYEAVRNDKVACDCGKVVLRSTLKRHKETVIHELRLQAGQSKRRASDAATDVPTAPRKVIQFERVGALSARATDERQQQSRIAGPSMVPLASISEERKERDDYYHYESVRSIADKVRGRQAALFPRPGLETSQLHNSTGVYDGTSRLQEVGDAMRRHTNPPVPSRGRQ